LINISIGEIEQVFLVAFIIFLPWKIQNVQKYEFWRNVISKVVYFLDILFNSNVLHQSVSLCGFHGSIFSLSKLHQIILQLVWKCKT